MKTIHLIMMALMSLFVLPVKAQYTVIIKDTPFNVDVDESTMTATLIDNTYSIDDRKYAVSNRSRKITGLKYEQSRTIEIPSTCEVGGKSYMITSVGRAAFAGYSNIDYIVVPSTVTSIGDYAFFNSSVIGVKLSESVSSIGIRAFGLCPKLKQLNLPASVQNTYGRALYSESKKCQPSYYQPNDNLAQNVVQAPIKQEQKAPIQPAPQKPVVQPAISSDIDVNIPESKVVDENAFAMIIANENYKNEVAVQFARNDGERVREYCEKVLGMKPNHIFYQSDATLGDMRMMKSKLERASKHFKNAKFLIYYAGHGIPDYKTKSAYLLPVDGSGNDMETAYSLQKLYQDLASLNAKSITIFLDACFSGYASHDDGMMKQARSVAFETKEEDLQGNLVVFSATSPGQPAWPYKEKGHGLFTYYFLKKLKDNKGDVTFGELDEYIREKVGQTAFELDLMEQEPNARPSSQLESTWRSMKLR